MRRAWLWGGSGLLLVLLVAFTLNEISKATCFAFTGDVVCRADIDQKMVALTFDDGPTELGVNAVLPILDRYEAKATFFLVGASPDLSSVRRIVAEGHEIGNHSLTHKRMVGRSMAFYDEEIRRTDAILRAAGAPKLTLFRPPFGKKLFGLPLAVQRNGYLMVMWDSGDPPDRDPKVYASKVLDQIRPGSITLIHPMFGSRQTERDALPLILQSLKQRGYKMVTVSELLAADVTPAKQASLPD